MVINSESLKKFRKEHHLSQEGFARLLNISSRSVARWESGRLMPSPMARQLIESLINRVESEGIGDDFGKPSEGH